jgi:dihydroxy-acid dehydratase
MRREGASEYDSRSYWDGERIMIDALACEVRLKVGATEMEGRHARWRAPPPKATRRVLARSRRLVRSTSEGAVTDPDLEGADRG